MATVQNGTVSGGGANVADTTPPYLIAWPTNGEPADTDLVLGFSEAIQAGSGSITLMSMTGQTLFTGQVANNPSIDIVGSKLTLHLSQALAFASVYRLDLSPDAVTDLSGNQFNSVVGNWLQFSTGLSPVPVNLPGTDGNDTLHGSELGDTISGGIGDDEIYGYGGDDLIHGGQNSPGYSITGDYIDGGAGNDQLYGDAGNDRLHGGAGNDTLDGGDGQDTLDDDEGSNVLLGGEGDDTLVALDYYFSVAAGASTLDGGAGNDSLAGPGSATLIGGAGDDRFRVGLFAGDAQSGYASGGDGKDTFDIWLLHGTSHYRVTGGAGSDTFGVVAASSAAAQVDITDFQPGEGGDLIDLSGLAYNVEGNPFAAGAMHLLADGADTLLQGKTDSGYHTLIRLAGVQPSQLISNNFVGAIDPTGGNKGNTITGTAGIDFLTGDVSNNTIAGLGGNDYLYGRDGDDSLDGGSGNDTLVGEGGNDFLAGGADNDTLIDSRGDNVMHGDGGNDLLIAESTGHNVVEGGEGNDEIRGGYGTDTLSGGAGNDTISLTDFDTAPHAVQVSGGDGNDVLRFYIGHADVTASGGAGADTFVLEKMIDARNIAITDFSASAGDRLDLRMLLPSGFIGNPFGPTGYLKAVQEGADTVIYLDRDGAQGKEAGFVAVATLRGTELATLPPSAFVGNYDPTGSTKGVVLTGTTGGDKLTGSDLDDTIHGGAGSDTIDGGFGDDQLDGGDETGFGDNILGGAGNDTIDGGAGSDVIDGEGGNDSIVGGAGYDNLRGGAGNDTLLGGDGDDTLSDDGGANFLSGGAGNDQIYGVDSYGGYGGPGDSTIDGGDGDDWLFAGGGNRLVLSGQGNDNITLRIDGNTPFRFEVDGGAGNDLIRVESSSATSPSTVVASGGAGRDTFGFDGMFLPASALTIRDFQTGPGGDVLDVLSFTKAVPAINPFAAGGSLRLLQDGADTLVRLLAGPTDTVGRTIVVLKNVVATSLTADNFPQGIRPDGSPTGMTLQGGDGDDNLAGGFLDDTIHGGAGNDTIDGKGGSDTLYGDAGNDTLHTQSASHLYGGDGGDDLSGVTGSTLSGDAGSDVLQLRGDNGRLEGGAGNDALTVFGSHNILDGGADDDALTAWYGENTLLGGAGNDVLQTWGAGETIDGGDGDDNIQFIIQPDVLSTQVSRIDGGDGKDRIAVSLNGTSASVVVHGGGGSDSFSIAKAASGTATSGATVTIDDFQGGPGGDVITLSGYAEMRGPNPFAPGGSLRVEQRGVDTVIMAILSGPAQTTFTDLLILKNVDKTTLDPINFWLGLNPDGSNTGYQLTAPDNDSGLEGGWLDDTLTGGLGNDYLSGKGGNDVLIGGAGNDLLVDDVLNQRGWAALRDSDRFYGGAGADELRSYVGSDTLDGGSGNDTVSITDMYFSTLPRNGDLVVADGGAGRDFFDIFLTYAKDMHVQLSGGADSDVFNVSGAMPDPTTTVTITDFEAGAGGDVLQVFNSYWEGETPFSGNYYKVVQRGADVVVQYDRDGPSLNSSFRDVVILKNIDIASLKPENTMGWPIDGRTKGDLIEGTAGADTLSGGLLADTIHGGDGNDLIAGMQGADVIDGGVGDDWITDGGGNDLVDGGPGNDYLLGDDGDDTLVGGDGDDWILAVKGNDLLQGGTGNDHLVAAEGDTVLDGEKGDDLIEIVPGKADLNTLLVGGDGNDTFRIHIGTQYPAFVTAIGGAGQDVFETGSPYTIRDFQTGAGGDLIDLAEVLARADRKTTTPFADAYLKLVQNGVDTLLQVRLDSLDNHYYYTLLTLKKAQSTAFTAENFIQHVDLPGSTAVPPSNPPPSDPPPVVTPPPV
jgi:Ca2+-binding RTX toxin-like protein